MSNSGRYPGPGRGGSGPELLIIWACFLLHGWFYAAAFPLWEGFDEYSHFALIQFIASHGSLPHPRTANSSEQVAQSLRLTPVPTAMEDFAPGLTTHDDYWQLPAGERSRRQEVLSALPPALATREADPRLPLYEAQQAPLYYWLASPIYRATAGLSLPSQVVLLRFVTVLLASALIPIAYWAGVRVFSSPGIALAIAILAACMPQLRFMTYRVSNEALSIVLGSLLFLVALQVATWPPTLARGILFGCVLGAALLTKAYFLALVPAAIALLLWTVFANSSGRKSAIRQACAAIVVAAVIAGWWYARIWHQTGSLSGEQSMSSGAHQPLWFGVTHTPWLAVWDFFAVSYLWLGNWSMIVLKSWMYRAMELMFLLAACGVALQAARPRPAVIKPAELWIAFVSWLSIFAGLCYQTALTYRPSAGGSFGYYQYCLVVPELVLIFSGLFRLLPVSWRRAPVAVWALLFAGLDLYGTWFLLLPYYAGITRHTAQGGLPALRLSQMQPGGWSRMFENLTANKPEWITSGALTALAAGSLLATLILLALSFRLALQRPVLPSAVPETPGPPDGSASFDGE